MLTGPELELIASYREWEFFVTLTYGGRVPRPTKARARLFRFLRQSCKASGIRFGQLFWVARNELGEKTSRYHHHLLLGRTGFELTSRTNFSFMKRWDSGFARCSVFDPKLSGAAYVAKCLHVDARAQGDKYELDKFAVGEEPPEFSHSFTKWLSFREGHKTRNNLRAYHGN